MKNTIEKALQKQKEAKAASQKTSSTEKIEDAIKRNPNPSSSYPFSSNLNQELLQYDELPPFTEIQIRTQE